MAREARLLYSYGRHLPFRTMQYYQQARPPAFTEVIVGRSTPMLSRMLSKADIGISASSGLAL